MKFCPKCGTANTNSSMKCSCGEDLSNVSAENAQPTTKAPQKSAAFMDSTSCKSMVGVFIVLAIIGAIVCVAALDSVTMAVVLGVSLVTVAITFSTLGGLLRNQEIQNEFMQEILNELKNKK